MCKYINGGTDGKENQERSPEAKTRSWTRRVCRGGLKKEKNDEEVEVGERRRKKKDRGRGCWV